MNPRSVSAWPVIFSIRYYNCSTLFIFRTNSSLCSAYSLSFRCRTDIFSSDWMSRCLSLSISYRSSDSLRWHSYSGMKAWVLLGSLVLYLFLCSYIFFKLLSFFNFSSKKQTFFSNAISFAVEFCCPFSSSSNLYFPPNIWQSFVFCCNSLFNYRFYSLKVVKSNSLSLSSSRAQLCARWSLSGYVEPFASFLKFSWVLNSPTSTVFFICAFPFWVEGSSWMDTNLAPFFICLLYSFWDWDCPAPKVRLLSSQSSKSSLAYESSSLGLLSRIWLGGRMATEDSRRESLRRSSISF